MYDDGDRLVAVTCPSGQVVSYTRDAVRRIEAIEAVVNGTVQTIVSGIAYRGDNQMTECTFGDGLVDTRSYDLQGRLTHRVLIDGAGGIIDERSYAYDRNSNILAIDTNVEDNAYQYDRLDRLTSDAIDAAVPTAFTYDLNDNRLTGDLADSSREDTYAYAPGTNRLEFREVFLAEGGVSFPVKATVQK